MTSKRKVIILDKTLTPKEIHAYMMEEFGLNKVEPEPASDPTDELGES